jgi:hypothetical protein
VGGGGVSSLKGRDLLSRIWLGRIEVGEVKEKQFYLILRNTDDIIALNVFLFVPLVFPPLSLLSRSLSSCARITALTLSSSSASHWAKRLGVEALVQSVGRWLFGPLDSPPVVRLRLGLE